MSLSYTCASVCPRRAAIRATPSAKLACSSASVMPHSVAYSVDIEMSHRLFSPLKMFTCAKRVTPVRNTNRRCGALALSAP